MARFFIKKITLLLLCISVFVLSILVGTVLSAWLVKVPEL
jgi:hypothetical protein